MVAATRERVNLPVIANRKRPVQTLDAIAAFLTAKRASKRSKATTDTYERALLRFLTLCPQLPATPEIIEAFLLSDPDLAATTARKHFSIVRNFLKWCERRYKMASPHRQVDAPKVHDPIPRFLEPAELYRLLTLPKLRQRDKALLWFLADTGLRIGEAVSLRRSGIRDGFVEVSGKVGPRFVPVTPMVLAMLREIPAPEPYVWYGKQGPLSVSGAKQLVRKAFKAAGIQGRRIGPHTLRHTFGTLWEGDETDMRQIGGWKDPRSVERYRHMRLARSKRSQLVHSPVQQLLKQGPNSQAQLPLMV